MELPEILNILCNWFKGIVNHTTDFPDCPSNMLDIWSLAEDMTRRDHDGATAVIEFLVVSKGRPYRAKLAITLEELTGASLAEMSGQNADSR